MEISVDATTGREEMLARIRSRLKSMPNQRRTAAKSAVPGQEREALIAQFTAKLEQAGGHVHRIPDVAIAREQLVNILRQCQARRIVVSAGVPGLSDLADEFEVVNVADLGNALRDTLAQTDVGITDVNYAIAETGTLVLCAQPGRPRLLSALPAVHIAVVRFDQVVASFADLASVVRSWAAGASHMTLITGPSRTGDIEQVITIGAHGPRELHVLLCEE